MTYEHSPSTREFHFRDTDISLGETCSKGGKYSYHWPGDYKAIIKYNQTIGRDPLYSIDSYKGWTMGYTYGTNMTVQNFTNDESYIRNTWGYTHLFVRWDHGDLNDTATTENISDLPFVNYAGEVHPGTNGSANMQVFIKWRPPLTGRVRIRGMVFDGHKTDMYASNASSNATGVLWWIAKMVGNPTNLSGGASIWRQYHDGGSTRTQGVGTFDFETDVTANQSDVFMLAVGPDSNESYDSTPVEMYIEYIDPPKQDVSLGDNLCKHARWYTILPGWEDSAGNWNQGSGKGPYLFPDNPNDNDIDASLGAWRNSFVMPTMSLIGWDSNTFVVNAYNTPPEVTLKWKFYDLIANNTVSNYGIGTSKLHRARVEWPVSAPFAGSTIRMKIPKGNSTNYYPDRDMQGSMLPYDFRWLERGGGLNYYQWPHHVRSSMNSGSAGLTVGASVTHDLNSTTTILDSAHGPFDNGVALSNAYRFTDWGGDIFDGWGYWWVQPETSDIPIAVPLPNTTATDATNYTKRVWQGTLGGTLFEITYGYGAQGIYRIQIVAGDFSSSVYNGTNVKFRCGTKGNLGSDTATVTNAYYDKMSYNGTVAERIPIYYDQWKQSGSSTEIHYHYVVPFNCSDSHYRPYATGRQGDNIYMYTDWLTHGVTLYLSKTNNVINWVENDLNFHQNFYT